MTNQTKIATITHKKGLQANLPTLSEAEFALTTDEKRIYIGSNEGNIELAKESEVVELTDKVNEITGDIYDLGSTSNVTLTQNKTGKLFTLTWANSTKTNYLGTEVYVSDVDLSTKKYDEVVSVSTKIYDGTGTTITHITEPNKFYFFKLYSRHNLFGKNKYDSGVSKYLKAVDTEPPAQVTSLTVKEDDKTVTLNWVNPTDTDYSKTTVVYKTDGYPTNKTDGTLAYSGVGTTVTLSSLVNEAKYYFSIFTEDINENIGTAKQITATPADVRVYGVKIDTTNSNPETALTYIEQSTGFTPAKMNYTTNKFEDNGWLNRFPFNQIKPCVMLNGVVKYYLNPNDYTKKLDGTTSDITSGTDGDVMIEFPKVYWKFETVGTDLYVRYATKQKDATYKCLAHTRGTTEKDKTYISAYLGFNLLSKLRSLSGKTPTARQTIGTFRTLSQANGTGYDQMGYYQLLMLQVLYLIMFKNRDSQSALGKGYTTSTNTAPTVTGNLNQKGLFYGEQTGKVQMKFCGVEDFYGNLLYWVDGIFSDASRNVLIGNQSFNDTGSGYTNHGQGATADIGGYVSSVQGGTETGFIAKATSGSATTYYPDYGTLSASRVACFGGYWTYASGAGAFGLRLGNAASASDAFVGARSMFC